MRRAFHLRSTGRVKTCGGPIARRCGPDARQEAVVDERRPGQLGNSEWIATGSMLVKRARCFGPQLSTRNNQQLLEFHSGWRRGRRCATTRVHHTDREAREKEDGDEAAAQAADDGWTARAASNALPPLSILSRSPDPRAPSNLTCIPLVEQT